jgi:hypothetical protein
VRRMAQKAAAPARLACGRRLCAADAPRARALKKRAALTRRSRAAPSVGAPHRAAVRQARRAARRGAAQQAAWRTAPSSCPLSAA